MTFYNVSKENYLVNFSEEEQNWIPLNSGTKVIFMARVTSVELEKLMTFDSIMLNILSTKYIATT